MIATDFAHVRAWVFDLDNTLYPPSARLFDQIEHRMVDYVMRELGVDRVRADHLRQHYWTTYGTTLAGLMREHDIDPLPYMIEVHDISLDHIEVDLTLRGHIARLPGRRIVYTNGPQIHAERVLRARGLEGVFDAIYGVEHSSYVPKPARGAFEAVFAQDGLDSSEGAMFEDDPRNLHAPHAMGMRTVLVGEAEPAPHIHHHTGDLTGFLSQVLG